MATGSPSSLVGRRWGPRYEHRRLENGLPRGLRRRLGLPPGRLHLPLGRRARLHCRSACLPRRLPRLPRRRVRTLLRLVFGEELLGLRVGERPASLGVVGVVDRVVDEGPRRPHRRDVLVVAGARSPPAVAPFPSCLRLALVPMTVVRVVVLVAKVA